MLILLKQNHISKKIVNWGEDYIQGTLRPHRQKKLWQKDYVKQQILETPWSNSMVTFT